MLSSLASDRPTVSYLPLKVAPVEHLIQACQLSAEVQELLQSQAPHVLEFSVVLDRLHGFSHAGQAVLTLYDQFLLRLAATTS